MNLHDYLLPIIIVLVIVNLLLFFKKNSLKNDIFRLYNSIRKNNIENFYNPQTHMVLTESPKIQGNLYMGYTDTLSTERDKNTIKNLIAKNPTKFRDINVDKNNIFVNGESINKLKNFKINKICVGSNNKKICENNFRIDKLTQCKLNKGNLGIDGATILEMDILIKNKVVDTLSEEIKEKCLNKHTVSLNRKCSKAYDGKQCIDIALVDKYTSNTIPRFLDANDAQVYYNHDNPKSNARKLNINGTEIDQTHLDIINGKKAILFNTDLTHLNTKDSEVIPNKIKSYGVEFAERPGFSNVIQRTFYMRDVDKTALQKGISEAKTCFAHDKKHTIYSPVGKARKYSGNFYMKPKKPKFDSYMHIHKHETDGSMPKNKL